MAIGSALVLFSALLYLVHYLIFKDLHHIFIYMVGDIAFVPLEVLLVTLVIHELLNIREKGNRMQKLNILIGVFFSEVGRELLARFSKADPEIEGVKRELENVRGWTERDFERAGDRMIKHDHKIDIRRIDLKDLRSLLAGKREFLVGLLENPNLLEHESFTDMMWSILHLDEELEHREDLSRLPESDLSHLKGDMERAYKELILQWLNYMRHLKENYPYLFSLATRINPFAGEESAVIIS